jgi:hypothetical protein
VTTGRSADTSLAAGAVEQPSIPDGDAAPGETCDHCGSPSLRWRKCKLICESCRQINKSCADL